MKRKRFSEEKIIGVLKERGAGAKADDICRRHGVSTPRSTPGARNALLSAIGPRTIARAAWKCQRPCGCESWRPRTPS